MDSLKTTLDGRRVYPITLVWGNLQEERKAPVYLDHKLEVMEPLTLFARYKAIEYLKRNSPRFKNKKAYISFIESISYGLMALAEYLRYKRIPWHELDDSHIVEFKLRQHQLVSAKSSAVTPETVNATVNKKIKNIYEFIWWAQVVQGLICNRISNEATAPIVSNIVSYKIDPTKFKSKADLKTIYPLLERITGEFGRHRQQHYATSEEIIELRNNFRCVCESLTAERNVLIVDIIENMGWREGSMASLTIGQFSEEVIANALKQFDSKVSIIPSEQKRGYQLQFQATVQLAIRINRYIERVRLKMLERINKFGFKDISENCPLFVSYTSGDAITGKTISRLVSDGFKRIGVVGLRAGPHSIRRKFGKDKSSEVCEVRQRKGLSTDPQDIMYDLAEFLGQSSLAAQNAYNAHKRDIYNQSIESGLRGQLAESECEVSSLKLKLQRCEARIKELE